jgi:hypothetical protein
VMKLNFETVVKKINEIIDLKSFKKSAFKK